MYENLARSFDFKFLFEELKRNSKVVHYPLFINNADAAMFGQKQGPETMVYDLLEHASFIAFPNTNTIRTRKISKVFLKGTVIAIIRNKS